MGKPFLWICCVLICVALAGCEADHNLVQEPDTGYTDADGYAVGTPYWWRTHPYFKDIDVDEEATLAAGDPYLVIHADEEDELGPMYDKLIEALIKQFRDEEISHVMGYHRVIAHIMGYHQDYVLSLKIPGVNMSLLEPIIPNPGPSPYVTIGTHCLCPWEWEDGFPPAGCDDGGGGGGGGGPPPPPPPPDPYTHTFMYSLGDPAPAIRKVVLYLSTQTANGVKMTISELKDIRIEKNGVTAYTKSRDYKQFVFSHVFTKALTYTDPNLVPWVSSADHKVSTVLRVIWTGHSEAEITY